jgi:hypothetical protein
MAKECYVDGSCWFQEIQFPWLFWQPGTVYTITLLQNGSDTIPGTYGRNGAGLVSNSSVTLFRSILDAFYHHLHSATVGN